MYDAVNTEQSVQQTETKISARNVQVYYGDNHAIKDVDVDILDKTVTAFIGPSGCGKSTFLRCLNRMNDIIETCRVSGDITLDGSDINSRDTDVVTLRARVGMVFQRPNPFPTMSIYDNVIAGLKLNSRRMKKAETTRLSGDPTIIACAATRAGPTRRRRSCRTSSTCSASSVW